MHHASYLNIGTSDFERSQDDLAEAKNPEIRLRAMDAVKILNVEQKKKLPHEDTLLPKLKMCLWILEARSFANSGDTKMYDERIAKVLGVCVRTAQRYVRRLEDLGFISRMTSRSFDKTRVKSKPREGFYSLRVIRCVRPFVKDSLKQQTTEELGWKSDVRPRIKPQEFPVALGWTLDEPKRVRNRQTLEVTEILPMAPSTIHMAMMGLWSFELEKYYYKIRNEWLSGSQAARMILGHYLREA